MMRVFKARHQRHSWESRRRGAPLLSFLFSMGTPRWGLSITATAQALCCRRVMRVCLSAAPQLGEPGQKTPPAPVRVSTVRDPAAFAAFVSGTDSLVALTLGLNNALIRFGPEQPVILPSHVTQPVSDASASVPTPARGLFLSCRAVDGGC